MDEFAKRMMRRRMKRRVTSGDVAKAMHPWMVPTESAKETLRRSAAAGAGMALLALTEALERCEGVRALPAPQSCYWVTSGRNGRRREGDPKRWRGVFTWDYRPEGEWVPLWDAATGQPRPAPPHKPMRYRMKLTVTEEAVVDSQLALRDPQQPANRWRALDLMEWAISMETGASSVADDLDVIRRAMGRVRNPSWFEEAEAVNARIDATTNGPSPLQRAVTALCRELGLAC